MTQSIIEARLKRYAPETTEEEEDALKEILQEIILNGLSNANFFDEAIFMGGTSLRIFHNLQRFSEDLDFILRKSNSEFNWAFFIKTIEEICKQYGIYPEVIDKSKAGISVQKMFLKDNSIGKILNLSFKRHHERKLTIKLEIDTNPPAIGKSEVKFLDFPLAFPVEVLELSTNFAGKSHALLCRKYTKGRDWYDFLWYVANGIQPNLDYLSSAINQAGPWANQNITLTSEWYIDSLKNRINEIDWNQAAEDVAPFLRSPEKNSLKIWSSQFFLDRLSQLKKSFIRL